MRKQKLYIGLALPGQKIQTIISIRMDISDRQETKELFNRIIDDEYDQLEERGKSEYETNFINGLPQPRREQD